jgi:predicted Zn-dependent protease with MMP-like domain
VHYKPDMSTSEPARIRWGAAPSLDDMAAMARAALETLEEPFRTHARAVAIKVEDFPDDELVVTEGIEEPYELTGLYEGEGLPSEEPWSDPAMPGRIWLYRLPILKEWAETGDITLEELVAHVVIHELGHHFGWSDDGIEAINDAED